MKNQNQVTFKCKHPGCKYVTTKEGYLRQHEKQKHGDNAGGSGDNENKSRKEKNQQNEESRVKKCPDCKGANIRLLNFSNPQERIAKQKGHKYLCEDCEEVF